MTRLCLVSGCLAHCWMLTGVQQINGGFIYVTFDAFYTDIVPIFSLYLVLKSSYIPVFLLVIDSGHPAIIKMLLPSPSLQNQVVSILSSIKHRVALAMACCQPPWVGHQRHSHVEDVARSGSVLQLIGHWRLLLYILFMMNHFDITLTGFWVNTVTCSLCLSLIGMWFVSEVYMIVIVTTHVIFFELYLHLYLIVLCVCSMITLH